MENTRPTKKIVLGISKKEIEVLTYITGREKRALTNVFLSKVGKVNIGDLQNTEVDPAIVDEAQDLALRTVVVSIDGKKDGEEGFDLVDTLLNLHNTDYEEVVSAVNEITSGKDFLVD